MNYSARVKNFLSKPQNVILLFMGCILIFTTIMPMVALVEDTFRIHPGTIDAHLTHRTSGYTFVNYIDLFTSRLAVSHLWLPLFNTLVFAIGACLVALFAGGTAAYFVVRSNIPCKKYISTIFILPSLLPHWTLAVVWCKVFNSNAVTNTPNGLLSSMLHINMPYWWCRGLFPCIIVLGITYAPFAFMLLGDVFYNSNVNTIKSALLLNTPRVKIFKRITLPMATPAILTTVLLVCDNVIGAYPIPSYLNLRTLSTCYMSMNSRYTGEARILAIIMIIAGITVNIVNRRFMQRQNPSSSMVGVGISLNDPFVLRFKTWQCSVITASLLIYTFLTSLLPILVLTLETFLPNPGDHSFLENFTQAPLQSLSKLTVKWWMMDENSIGQLGIFFNREIWKALGGSLWVSLCSTLLAGTLGTLLGYALTRPEPNSLASKYAKYVNTMVTLSSYIPSFAMGVAFYLLASNNHLNLFNTYTLLIIVGTVKYIPFVSNVVQDSMRQLSHELEDAAILLNTPWLKRMTRIVMPLQKSTVLRSYFLPFTECLREVSLFMLLCTSGTILPTMVDYFDEIGFSSLSGGVDLILILVILSSRAIFGMIVKRITQRDMVRRIHIF